METDRTDDEQWHMNCVSNAMTTRLISSREEWLPKETRITQEMDFDQIDNSKT